jgi:hypothetical protein
MRKKEKNNFIKEWENYINELNRIGWKINDLDDWKKLRKIVGDLQELVLKVAEET